MLLIENARNSFIPTLRHIDLAKKTRKYTYSNNNDRRNEDPIDVGFVNGFCFGCTSKTFSNNMYVEKHYFNPNFSFEGIETESQLRSFNLKLASTPLNKASMVEHQ